MQKYAVITNQTPLEHNPTEHSEKTATQDDKEVDLAKREDHLTKRLSDLILKKCFGPAEKKKNDE